MPSERAAATETKSHRGNSLTSTMLRRSLTYMRSVSMISMMTRSRYVSLGLGAMALAANGESGAG